MYSPVVAFARRLVDPKPKRLVTITVPIAFKTKSSYVLVFINLATLHESNKIFLFTNVQ